MIKHFLFSSASALAMVAALLFTPKVHASPVVIHIHGLHTQQGSILVNLFTSATQWSSEVPNKVLQITPLKGADAVATFDLPPGTYGFFLFHDEDGNGQLKRGIFGLPAEPYAFSNNVHLGLSKPSFANMSFVVTASGAQQEINLIRPAGLSADNAKALKMAKLLFDQNIHYTNAQLPFDQSCGGPGMRCENSVDCCGSSFCHGGYCDAPAGQCVPYGGGCTNSVDCCGANFCRDGYCH
jgi:uncharacterized protein (DUF2141 family)